MKEYGIDGVFMQRFAAGNPPARQFNTVLNHAREGEQVWRTYAVMYDLSGIKAGQMDRVMNIGSC